MVSAFDDVLRHPSGDVEEYEVGDHAADAADRVRLLRDQLLGELGMRTNGLPHGRTRDADDDGCFGRLDCRGPRGGVHETELAENVPGSGDGEDDLVAV